MKYFLVILIIGSLVALLLLFNNKFSLTNMNNDSSNGNAQSEQSFENEYPNPVIAGEVPLSIAGFSRIIYVFDKANEGEDPLMPDAWLELTSGKKFTLNPPGIRKALLETGFIPKNEADATSLAKILLSHSYFNQVPKIISSSIVKSGDDFIVEFDVDEEASEFVHLTTGVSEQIRIHYTFTLGKNYNVGVTGRDNGNLQPDY